LCWLVVTHRWWNKWKSMYENNNFSFHLQFTYMIIFTYSLSFVSPPTGSLRIGTNDQLPVGLIAQLVRALLM